VINLEDEVIYDHRLSCTEEEAVAKLLGWMQGSKRLRHLAVTEDGLNADQFPHMYQLPSSISEFIGDEREQASIRFQNACVAKNFELAAKWESVVEYWDAINERAVRYKQGIAAELSRPKPRLITDKAISDETGFITSPYLALITGHASLMAKASWIRSTKLRSLIYLRLLNERESKGLKRNAPSSRPSSSSASTPKKSLAIPLESRG
jgi:hypothetical protein